MNPTQPATPRSACATPEHQELSRRVRGVRFARMRCRLACTVPVARREENGREGGFLGESFAFRRS